MSQHCVCQSLPIPARAAHSECSSNKNSQSSHNTPHPLGARACVQNHADMVLLLVPVTSHNYRYAKRISQYQADQAVDQANKPVIRLRIMAGREHGQGGTRCWRCKSGRPARAVH